MLNLPLLGTTHTLTHMSTHTHTQTPMRSHTPLPHKDTHPGPAQKANEDGLGGGGELSLEELGAGISKQSWFRNAGNVDSRPFPAEVGEGRWGQASGPWEQGGWTGRVQAPGEGVKLQTGSTKSGRGQRRQKRAWGWLPKLPFPHTRDLAPFPLAWSKKVKAAKTSRAKVLGGPRTAQLRFSLEARGGD